MRKPAFCAVLLATSAAVLLATAPAVAVAAEDAGTVTLYRLYNPNSGEHFYTASDVERASLVSSGWDYEGLGWTAPSSSSSPVYRLYNPNAGDHHYTMSQEEKNSLVSSGWRYEGIGWYSDDDAEVPLFRQYNPNAQAGAHNYTTSPVERDHLVSVGWNDEHIGWYGVEEQVVERTPIMGESQATAERLAAYYRSKVGEATYPSSVYADKGAATIDEFCKIVVEEARAEGVRAEVVFAQAMKETGWLRFGGAVKAEQCNFCGLGAVNSNPGAAATFEDVRRGIRAQVQHLKAYASTDSLKNACVDPRFGLVTRGIAPTLEELNGRWAVPGNGYGEDIARLIDEALALKL